MKHCSDFTDFTLCGNPLDHDDACVVQSWKTVGDSFHSFTSPIVAIAICMNIFTVFVCFRQNLRHVNSAIIYLVSLAVSDLVYLVSFAVQIYLSRQDAWTTPSCKVSSYVYMVAAAMGPLTVVAYTVERLMAVRFPFTRMRACYPRRAAVILGAILVVCLLIYLPYIVIIIAIPVNNGTYTCHINESDPMSVMTLNGMEMMDLVVAWCTPVLTICTCNPIIICVLRRRRSMVKNNLDELKSTVRMLQIITVVFITLNTPVYLVPLIRQLVDKKCGGSDYVGALTNTKFDTINSLSHVLYIINFGSDLALYCMASREFRKEIVNIFKELYFWGKAKRLRGTPNKKKKIRHPTETTDANELEGVELKLLD